LNRLTPDQLEAVHRHFPRPKFFIFGHARSGTTLLGRLARIHPEIHCDWQAQFFARGGPIPFLTAPDLLRWMKHPANHWTASGDPVTVMVRVYCDFVLEAEAARAGKRIVGDKSTNGNADEAVRWLAAVYPDSSLVYIVRDGRDTVLSKRIQAFLDQPQFLADRDRKIRAAVLREPRAFLEGRSSLFSRPWLVEAAEKWSKDVRSSVEAGRRLFGDRFLAVRYEDFLQDPPGQSLAMWSFLQASPPAGEWRALVAAEMAENPSADWHASGGTDFVSALPRGRAGVWKSLLTGGDRELFERIAGGELRQWGYEVMH
jgi:hypothetical protein